MKKEEIKQMVKSNSDSLTSSVTTVLKEKKALSLRERLLVRGLNRVLKRMGYEVVKMAATTKRRRKAGNGRRRKRKGERAVLGSVRPRSLAASRRGRGSKK